MSQTTSPLWTIGVRDGRPNGFALAPDGWARYESPKPFVVGKSEPKTDWPYVLPGPADPWATGKSKLQTVVFSLKDVPSDGVAKLVLSFVDTHSVAPPTLEVRVNGWTTRHPLTGGWGDGSINGKPEEGKPSEVVVNVPVGKLQTGHNVVEIENVSGCWLVWDALSLDAPRNLVAGSVTETFTVLTRQNAIRGLIVKNGRQFQPVDLTFLHEGPAVQATIRTAAQSVKKEIKAPQTTVRLLLPAVERPEEVEFDIHVGNHRSKSKAILKPVRKMKLFILNHSHVDIGFTASQDEVARKQADNLRKAIQLAKETAKNPPGSRFVWNAEIAWTVDVFRKLGSQKERDELDEAVRKGWVHLEGAYLNMLTGLCHPEELIRLTEYARREADRLGVPLRSAMQSDTPGYAWGTVDALAHAGIRYLSIGHNRGYVRLSNLAFWWESKSGQDRVLVWTPFGGYDLCSLIQKLDAPWLSLYQDKLDETNYAYDLGYIRWNGAGDNAAPDRSATDFAKAWNKEFVWPKLEVCSTTKAFTEFERKYGESIPTMRREFTPLWEDGAGSTALETSMGRNSAVRLAQIEALAALLPESSIDRPELDRAWNEVLFFSEHTWGSFLSVMDPEHPQSREQWERKRQFAVQAEEQSKFLLDKARGNPKADKFQVVNTCGWQRDGLVEAPPTRLSRVLDGQGQPVPSQRMHDGRLVFLARSVPAFGFKTFRVVEGEPFVEKPVSATGNALTSDRLSVRIDPATGDIAELRIKGEAHNFVDGEEGLGLNAYRYLAGSDKPGKAQASGRPKVEVVESGPLVAKLRITSQAPGTRGLVREVGLVSGLDWVDIWNTIEKTKAPPTPGTVSYAGSASKESVFFRFPFRVPNGKSVLDRGFGNVDTGRDMMERSMSNWFSVGQWASVESDGPSVVLATPDTPLIQVGGITNWVDAPWQTEPVSSPNLSVWAMNNYWATNYKAYQEGPVGFRFGLKPSTTTNAVAMSRFGWQYNQPLLCVPHREHRPEDQIEIDGDGATVVSLRVSQDAKARILTILGGPMATKVRLSNAQGKNLRVWRTDANDAKIGKPENPISVPGHGVVFVRVER